MSKRLLALPVVLGVVLFPPQRRAAADDLLPDNDVIMRAMVHELSRSMKLHMEDLEEPYFIQFSADDSITYRLTASYGAIISSQRDRSREFHSRVRIGSIELDNTNFTGGGGGERSPLPLGDDEIAIRQFIWRATDRDYKSAVETLTRKRAYMEDKNLEDRPNDFSHTASIEHVEAGAQLEFDKATWEQNLRRLSSRFKRYERVQDSSVRLFVGAGNSYVVNSEGTRVRTGDQGVLLVIIAEAQADNGMRISGGRAYSGDTTRDLPTIDKMLSDIDAVVATVNQALAAPILEEYIGPVLFDGQASGQVFRQLLADGVAGKVSPVGTQRRRFEGAESLEKKLGRRILPKSFQVYDDPSVKKVDDTALMGHYRYDDEGVKARRVEIVVDGVLKDMAMSRVPTKKLSGSNGHGRRGSGARTPLPAIACLFVKDNNGLTSDELKAELIEAAEDEGLDFALRVTSLRSAGIGSSQSDIFAFFMRLQRGGSSGLSDPVLVYKVYVDDGREELVRGCEFGPVEVRSLREIIAAGTKQTVYNYIDIGFSGASPPSSIIAPSILFKELDVSRIEREHVKLPILKAPAARDAT